MDKQYCMICGKELNARQIKRGNQVCSRSCSLRKRYLSAKERKKMSDKLKEACARADVRQRRQLAAQQLRKNPEYRRHLSESISAAWRRDEVRAHHKQARADASYKKQQSDSQKRRFTNTDAREILSKRISELWKDEEYAQKTKAGMHEKWKDQEFKKYHREQTSIGTKAAFDLRGDEIIAKIHKTKLVNGTFPTSEEEDFSYQLLLKVFKEVRRQELYPFNKRHACDFYVVDLDLWIECNYHDSHNPAFGPFDETNMEHLKELERLQKAAQKDWRSARRLAAWAIRDVQRRREATQYGLNYKEFYHLDELKKWLKCFSN